MNENERLEIEQQLLKRGYRLVSLEDTINFRCRKCGRCCVGRESFDFSAKDLFYAAKNLGRTTNYLLAEYFDMHIEPGTGIPVAIALTEGSNKACSFLRNKKCILGENRPDKCKIHPIGRISSLSDGEAQYIWPLNLQCGKPAEDQTVLQYLNQLNLDNWWSELWGKALGKIYEFMPQIIHRCLCMGIDPADYLTELLYLRYDTALDFRTQFEQNVTEILTGKQV